MTSLIVFLLIAFSAGYAIGSTLGRCAGRRSEIDRAHRLLFDAPPHWLTEEQRVMLWTTLQPGETKRGRA